MIIFLSTQSLFVTWLIWLAFMATKWTVAARSPKASPVTAHPVVSMFRHSDDTTWNDHDECHNLDTTTWWKDEDSDAEMRHKCERKLPVIHRLFRPWTTISRLSPPPTQNNLPETPGCPPPHPLRTDRYEIYVQWRGPTRNRRRRSVWTSRLAAIHDAVDPPQDNVTTTTTTTIYDTSTFQLEFDPNGYVRLFGWHPPPSRRRDHRQPPSQHDAQEEYIGTWKLQPDGLMVHLPLPPLPLPTPHNGTPPRSHIILTMDFHVNPFGSQPKLTRGVLRRREGPFRPIVGTCTGTGMGVDTMDLSYQQRIPTQ